MRHFSLKRAIARIIVLFLLRLHQRIYLMLGNFSCMAEGMLHPKHRLTNYHQFFVDNINEGDRVLDLGCGNGALSFDVAKKAKFVKGIDKSERNIVICRKKYGRDNIEYVVGDIIEDLPKEQFDSIILSNVLEHIDNREEFLKRLPSISSRLVMRVPMLNRDWVTLYKKELGLPYMLDSTHKIEYTLDSLKDECGRAGFKLFDYSIQFGEIWAVVVKANPKPN